MRYLFSLSVLVLIFTPVFVARAGVIDTFLKKAGSQAYYEGSEVTPPDPAVVVGKLVQQVLLLAGVILFGIFIYAGIIWMTASGSEERVEKAKNLLQNAFWGMVITGGAYTLAFFVTEKIFKAATGG